MKLNINVMKKIPGLLFIKLLFSLSLIFISSSLFAMIDEETIYIEIETDQGSSGNSVKKPRTLSPFMGEYNDGVIQLMNIHDVGELVIEVFNLKTGEYYFYLGQSDDMVITLDILGSAGEYLLYIQTSESGNYVGNFVIS